MNLDLLTMGANDVDKEGTHNTNMNLIDDALTSTATITVSASTATYNPTANLVKEAAVLSIAPNGGDPPTLGQIRTVNIPAGVKKFWIVKNTTAATVVISQTTTVSINPGKIALVVVEGASASTSDLTSLLPGAGRWLPAADYAFISNISLAALNNGFSSGGDTVVTNDTVLLTGQTDPLENGLYTVPASGTASRSSQLPAGTYLSKGSVIHVKSGQFSNSLFIQSTTGTPVLGVTTVTWVNHSAGGPYDIGAFYPGTPAVTSLIWRHVVTRSMWFLDNFSDCLGHVGTNPTSNITLEIRRNGTAIGTIDISAAGVFTFGTTAATNEVFNVGDRLEISTTAAVNFAADISLAFKGRRFS